MDHDSQVAGHHRGVACSDIELHQNRWRLRDENGEIIADSAEGDTRESSVRQAIPNLKDAAAHPVVGDLT
jgi:uncharacterized protein YegP (UPF0339 family)